MKSIILIFIAFFFSQKSIFSQIFISTNSDFNCNQNVDLTLVESDFHNNGTFTPSTSHVFFKESNGSSNSKISGNSTTTFNNITIDIHNHSLQLMQNINMNGTINFSNGNFELNAFNVNLGTNGMISGETENSSFIGSSGGNINISADLNAPNSANPGNLGAIITSAENLGITTVSVNHMENTNGSNVSILRTYDITPTNNSGLNATLRFQYLDSELNGIPENELELWRNDGSGWQYMGFTSRDATNNYVELTGIDAFSQWTATNSANALPVELTYFEIEKVNNNSSLLKWATAAELNNEGFEIQRAVENEMGNLEWEVLDFIAGKGTTIQSNQYDFLDTSPQSGFNYYRLRQIDFDGKESFSTVRVLSFDELEEVLVGSIFPNPLRTNNNEVNIIIEHSKTEKTEIQVFDNFGKKIKEQFFQLEDGKNELQLDAQNLQVGVYYFIIKIEGGQYVRKLIVL